MWHEKKKGSGWREKSWDVKNDGCDLPNCLEISVYVCIHVSFHQSLAFCFGDYMYQGTNDRNLTISRLDYREDDRHGMTLLSAGLKWRCFQGLTGRLRTAWFASWVLTLYYNCFRLDRCINSHTCTCLIWLSRRATSLTIVHNVWPENCRSWLCSFRRITWTFDSLKYTSGSLIRYTFREKSAKSTLSLSPGKYPQRYNFVPNLPLKGTYCNI